jgi:hypothetical protein
MSFYFIEVYFIYNAVGRPIRYDTVEVPLLCGLDGPLGPWTSAHYSIHYTEQTGCEPCRSPLMQCVPSMRTLDPDSSERCCCTTTAAGEDRAKRE